MEPIAFWVSIAYYSVPSIVIKVTYVLTCVLEVL